MDDDLWHRTVAHVQDNPKVWERFLRWTLSGASMAFAFRLYWYSQGRDIFPRNASPMHVLCYMGLEKLVVRAFIERETAENSLKWAMANTRDNAGRAPLHWAAIYGHAEVVDTLLKKKADPHMKAPADNGHTCTPLDLAVEYGHSDVVLLLLRHSGDHMDHGRLLEMAAAGGNTEVMDAISTYGIDTNIPVGDHGSALHSAAFLDHVEVVRWLLRNRANVNMNNAKHGTPQQVATYEGNLEVIKFLLNHEADPNLGDGVYGNPLNAAAFRDWKDVFLELHRRGANINAKAGQYGSAINTARMNGHTTMVTLLQSLGAASTGFKAPLHRPSALDEATLYGVSPVENEIKKGRLPAVEKRAKKFIDGLLTAVEAGNKRRLDVMLQIGLNLFKAGVKADREGFLLLIVRTAMIILQTAVNRQFQEGIKTMTNLYTTALTFALDQGKPALVERLLYECVKDFNTLIDDGKDVDAEDLVNAAIETLFTVVEGGKEQLIEIMAKKWAALFEGLTGGRFGKKALSIIQSYTLRLTSAVEERDTRGVVGWGKTAVEFLSAAISGGHKEVARVLSSLFSQTLQSIIDIDSNNSTEWFMNESQRAVSQICTGGLYEKQVTRMWMLRLGFLLATEGG